jgi:hypothetical protein
MQGSNFWHNISFWLGKFEGQSYFGDSVEVLFNGG